VTNRSATKTKTGYLPGLDGWRAISILGVLLTHDRLLKAGKIVGYLQDLGFIGVYFFFAISGFLITWRLLDDEQVKGSISLKGFYIRRLFRIQPASLAYLGVIAVLMSVGFLHERWQYWFGALFAYRNFQFHDLSFGPVGTQDQWFTGQFWSLAVEEHFYLLLSLIFVVFRRNRLAVFSGLFCLLVVAQQWAAAHGMFSADVSGRRTFWVLQYLLFPSVLACCFHTRRATGKAFVPDAVRGYLRPWIVFSATVLLIVGQYLIFHYGESPNVVVVVRTELTPLFYCFGFWVVATVFHPRSFTCRMLETPLLRFLGRISYSTYLWQQVFLCHVDYITWKPFVWVTSSPLRYAAILLCAVSSYYFVEKPMIRFGHRLAPPASPGHRDLEVSHAH
jgi:peptidoglycan/LPS O-acetylase OafA/YrhL